MVNKHIINWRSESDDADITDSSSSDSSGSVVGAHPRIQSHDERVSGTQDRGRRRLRKSDAETGESRVVGRSGHAQMEMEEERKWEQRRDCLNKVCRVSNSYLRKGVPRIRMPGGSMVNMPREKAFEEHGEKLRTMFQMEFKATNRPQKLKLYSLCSVRNCVEPDHLVLMSMAHKIEMEEIRKERYGEDRWWRSAEEYYDVYIDIIGHEVEAERKKGMARKSQQKYRKATSRRKSRLVPESEIEKAVTKVFSPIGATGNVMPFTYRMWKEFENTVMNNILNVMHKTLIDYSNRAAAIRDGVIRDHERPQYTYKKKEKKK